MHLLELAKSAWNKIITSPDMNNDAEGVVEKQVRIFLYLSRKVLAILGPEGDENGPLQEIETLQLLLDD